MRFLATLLLCCALCCLAEKIVPLQQVQVQGRFLQNSEQMITMDWSGVTLTMNTTCSTLKIRIFQQANNFANQFNLLVNYKFVQVIKMSKQNETIVLFENEVPQVRVVQLVKRTEALFLPCTVEQVTMDDAGQVAAVTSGSTRKLEFIGDSITCAFGNEGKSPCPFTADTENEQESYAFITAKALQAQVHVECWSGRGMVRNYNDSKPLSAKPMPYYVPLSVANDDNAKWDFSKYIPDAVVINLGSKFANSCNYTIANDYSTQPWPTEEQFATGYINFVHYMKQYYPNAHIFAACGPMTRNPCCTYVQHIVEKLSQEYNNVHYLDLQIAWTPEDIGCAGHPSVLMHTKMAKRTTEAIANVLHW